ncbi:MAG TPA: ABC transporter permease [Verrucomicrobiae bacterium]|nr:ABC transporter permease [Verrucomicrobiae bacterium]
MQRLFAIAGLTWKAAFRFRLFLVIAALLLVSVVGLPLVIKDDGTAQGFTQILLTYTLSVITGLLGLSTLWLSCGTLARDIEECQVQVVATKPIARWQIWLGKWLGIMSLNAALLALSGACVYGLLYWRAARLPAAEQKILHEQVLVARGSAKPANPNAEIDAQTRSILQDRLKSNPELANSPDLPEVLKQIRGMVAAGRQLVPPDYQRTWQINLGFAKNFLRDKPLQLRVKFNAAQKSASGTFLAMWQVGEPNVTPLWQTPEPMSLAPDTFHEFQIPPNLFDSQGVLTVVFWNPPPNDTTLVFPLEDGIEVLYPEGGFALNFARGLGIIFCWMAFLAALGLTAASFLSFPVAAFFSMAILVVGLSGGTLAQAVEAGTVVGGNGETGVMGHSLADTVLIPLFKGLLLVINLVRNFSPIDSLSSGRSISWMELGTAFGQIVLLLGGITGLIGIGLFNRRELATAQGNQ